jgi:hypothetical protein
MAKTVVSTPLDRVLLRVEQLISIASHPDPRRRELVGYRIGQLSEAYSSYRIWKEDKENFVKEVSSKLK